MRTANDHGASCVHTSKGRGTTAADRIPLSLDKKSSRARASRIMRRSRDGANLPRPNTSSAAPCAHAANKARRCCVVPARASRRVAPSIPSNKALSARRNVVTHTSLQLDYSNTCILVHPDGVHELEGLFCRRHFLWQPPRFKTTERPALISRAPFHQS